MIYTKDNVERYVTNLVDAKKLEVEGFKPVKQKTAKPVREEVNAESGAGEIPFEFETPHRGRRKKEI